MSKTTSIKIKEKMVLTDTAPRLKNIWEVQPNFKCPVIGACLTVEEHKKVLKKAGCQIKKMSPHELHRLVMERLYNENRISRKVESYLKYKYRNRVATLADLDEGQFMGAWREGFQEGRMDGLFYVAAIRDDLSDESLVEIFGEIHMLSHANLAEVMKTRRSLSQQVKVNQKLAKTLNQGKKRIRDLKQDNSKLKAELHKTRLLMEKLKKTPVKAASEEKAIENFYAENQTLREKLKKMENQNMQKAEQVRYLKREKKRLQIELFDLKSTSQSLADEMNGFISQISNFISCDEDCDAKCPKFHLCAKRILIVGGITKMKHLYQHLVESGGGKFEYHDGYMNSGNQDLEARVRRSDLIICPVSCNSHGACLSVKKLCRKHNKPVKMLPSPSLSSISNALFENCVGAN